MFDRTFESSFPVCTLMIDCGACNYFPLGPNALSEDKNFLSSLYINQWRTKTEYTPVRGSVTRGLFFKIWPLATIKISQIMYQICQNRLHILPNNKKCQKIAKDMLSLAKVAKFSQIWSHWSQATCLRFKMSKDWLLRINFSSLKFSHFSYFCNFPHFLKKSCLSIFLFINFFILRMKLFD